MTTETNTEPSTIEPSTGCEATDPTPAPEVLGATPGQVRVAIDTERAYQDDQTKEGGKFEGRYVLTVDEEVELLNEYAGKALSALGHIEPQNVTNHNALVYVRKIAAIAVRCMENNGAQKREGY